MYAIRSYYAEMVAYGISRKETTLDEAIALNLIDKKASLDDLSNADLVVISIPVDATVKMLPTILDKIPDTALVVDAGSTKEAICKVVENHPKRRNFLAAHPIAGTEFSGVITSYSIHYTKLYDLIICNVNNNILCSSLSFNCIIYNPEYIFI